MFAYLTRCVYETDVGIGIAMENASPLTKSYAKAITLDNQNDGVDEYIEKFILGEEK